MKIMLMVIGLLLSLSASVHSASFDCDKASNFAEHEVCADKELSSLDDKLSALYKKVRKTAGNWREGQLKWLKARNQCQCQTCLLTAYQTRIAYFETSLSKKNVEITRGGAYQLCKDYAGLMSRVTINPKSSCNIRYSFDSEAYEAGFSDFKWEEVKKSNVKSILLGYWLPRKDILIDDYNADISLQKKFNEFYANHKVIWEANVDINFDGEKEQLYKISIAQECSGHRFSYFVLPMYDGRLSAIRGDLFFYQGRAYLQQGRALLELSGGGNIIHDKYVCNFKK